MPKRKGKNEPSHSERKPTATLETETAGQQPAQKRMTGVLIKIGGFFCFILLILTVLLVFAANHYFTQFVTAAQISRSDFFTQIQTALRQSPEQTDGRVNVLVLGTDSLANRAGDPVLTDTMMLMSVNLDTGELRTLSLPRDLWSKEYQTKINALYHYGTERYPQSPEDFSTQVIESMTGVVLHHTLVVSMDSVAALIDTLGGVDVEVKMGFVDTQFPRTNVDIRRETDPNVLYETVEFITGSEHMSGDRALKFMRSRKSADMSQGTDDARSQRQQQLIAAVIQKISDPQIIRKPRLLGELYRWYSENFEQQLPISEVLSLANQLRTKLTALSFSPAQLSIETEESPGVIVHPPVEKYQQWVYEVNDTEMFQQEIRLKLDLP